MFNDNKNDRVLIYSKSAIAGQQYSTPQLLVHGVTKYPFIHQVSE